jgi:hypothetical protein
VGDVLRRPRRLTPLAASRSASRPGAPAPWRSLIPAARALVQPSTSATAKGARPSPTPRSMAGMDPQQRARLNDAVRRTQASGISPEQLFDMLSNDNGAGPFGETPVPTTRKDLIETHNIWKERVDSAGHDAFAANSSSNQKPYSEHLPPPPLSKCTPIGVKSLALNTIHKLRYLRGTLIVEPFATAAAQTVLEDPNGGVVRVRPLGKPAGCAGQLPGRAGQLLGSAGQLPGRASQQPAWACQLPVHDGQSPGWPGQPHCRQRCAHVHACSPELSW